MIEYMIDGREVILLRQDFTIVRGSLGDAHLEKISIVMDHAVIVGTPFIGLNHTGEARIIQERADALAADGQIFNRCLRSSSRWRHRE
jgi:acetyl-CoA carboxylase carboxyltransferase component